MPPEQLLDRDSLRLGHLEKPNHIVVKHGKPLRKGKRGRRRDRAVLQKMIAPPFGAKQTEARRGVAGVDPQNNQVRL